MVLLYNAAIGIYGMAIRIAALFNPKARAWIDGRRALFSDLQDKIDPHKQWIWMHVASLGEFEQGKPLLESLGKQYPEKAVLVTFFSPSGYQIRKNDPSADFVTYLPLDTRSNARTFIELIRPALAIFVKYELWYHYLNILQERQVPTLLISAQLRPGQFYFKWFGRFLLKRIRQIDRIFVTNEDSLRFLKDRGLTNAALAGDTRVDRVLKIARHDRDFRPLQECIGTTVDLVAGSTWPADESLLVPLIRSHGLTAVIAPHEIGAERVDALCAKFGDDAIRLSELRSNPQTCRVVIVDTMGELAYLYALGQLAYVGGGFGSGIHNILEPLAHRIPVIFGPNYERFEEARTALYLGIARSVNDHQTMSDAFEAFRSIDMRLGITQYLTSNEGATDRISVYIRDQRWLAI